MSWSVRYGGRSQHADCVFGQLGDYCRELLREHLPAGSGYEIGIQRLSGPLDGCTFTVCRGNFRGVISVQRYARVDSNTSMELRVIATARHHVGHDDDETDRALARFGVAGCAVGTISVAVLGVELAGILSAWSHIALLLPIVMALQVFGKVTARPPVRPKRRALCEPHPRAARSVGHRDAPRWERVLTALAGQHESVANRFSEGLFRSPGELMPATHHTSPPTHGIREISANP